MQRAAGPAGGTSSTSTVGAVAGGDAPTIQRDPGVRARRAPGPVGDDRLGPGSADRNRRGAAAHARVDDHPAARRGAPRQPPGPDARPRLRTGRVPAVPAGRRRATDRLERHRPHERDLRARPDRRPTTSSPGWSSMRRRRCMFGTVPDDKAQTALAAAATVGFLSARNQNRLGAVLVAGNDVRVLPPRQGKNQVRACSRRSPRRRRRRAPVAPTSPARSTGSERSASGAASSPSSPTSPGRTGSRRSGASACGTTCWRSPSTTRVSTTSRRSVWSSSPTRRPVRCARSASPRRSSGGTPPPPPIERAARLDALGRAGAETIELSTASDWLGAIVQHVHQRRVQAVRGGVMPR